MSKVNMSESEIRAEIERLDSMLLRNCGDDCTDCGVSEECNRYAYLCQLLGDGDYWTVQ